MFAGSIFRVQKAVVATDEKGYNSTERVLTLQDGNNVLPRQIKAFAQGFGYLLAKHGAKSGNEFLLLKI